MFTEERRREIIAKLKKEKIVLVNDLCQEYQVSSATIRTDLSYLEEQGYLKRTHGGAIPNHGATYEMTTEEKKNLHIQEKTRIGQYASTLINDGDTIAIDCGTTAFCLVENLLEKENLTVITNDIKIASFLQGHKNISTILIGGIIRKGHYCTVGSFANEMLKQFNVDKSFVVTNSIDRNLDLSTPDLEQAEIKKSLLSAGKFKYLLADSTKFGNTSFVKFAKICDFNLIVTDLEIDDDYDNKITSKGVDLKKV